MTRASAPRNIMSYDILIRGGLVIDGSGGPGEIADVAVSDGRIAAVGRSLPTGAARTIDAEGLAVVPGFIDIKTHSDFTLPINPKAESKVRQGVTTEIVGHCGFSVAPIIPGKRQLVQDYLSASAPWLPFRETTFREYLDGFPQTSVNAGMLVGHHILRLNVMGMEARPPSPAELEHMTALLEEGLAAGALGLSSGLFTPPSSYADRAEMVALCNVLRRRNAGYFTHLRDESNNVIAAVEEAIDIARTCGVHVEIVHLKCSGLDNWGKAAQILTIIDAARQEGLAVDCDAYPYRAGSNPLKNLLPQWVQSDGLEAMLARLALAETRTRIRAEIDCDGLNNWGRIPSWDSVQISISPCLPQYAGETFGKLATARGRDPVDVVCDYLIEDKGATRVLITSIAEEDIREIVRSPSALVGSDGNCVADYGVTSQGMPHPRFYGTFPRIIGHYVHEQHLLPLEQAVRKMTGATAAALRLRDRGLIKEGYRADIAVFDPADFKDRATPGTVLRRAADGTVG
jgi:N-acyl-D-amino-acid deacylase